MKGRGIERESERERHKERESERERHREREREREMLRERESEMNDAKLSTSISCRAKVCEL